MKQSNPVSSRRPRPSLKIWMPSGRVWKNRIWCSQAWTLPDFFVAVADAADHRLKELADFYFRQLHCDHSSPHDYSWFLSFSWFLLFSSFSPFSYSSRHCHPSHHYHHSHHHWCLVVVIVAAPPPPPPPPPPSSSSSSSSSSWLWSGRFYCNSIRCDLFLIFFRVLWFPDRVPWVSRFHAEAPVLSCNLMWFLFFLCIDLPSCCLDCFQLPWVPQIPRCHGFCGFRGLTFKRRLLL